ncbi:MAG: hypothetical protein LBJ65_04020 [Burkholderia sp.]|jgi:hypothetical protein|uniref:hypothetical protein n=1 Tax=Burkholderia sp. TaxID=36773 RepID=UPI00281E5B4A|nr:hypothetical protein [Burkholderia sp.]MDR0240751.1 hypothetical protein [Burkholderia sp.]
MMQPGKCHVGLLRVAMLIAGAVSLAIYPVTGMSSTSGGNANDPIEISSSLPKDLNNSDAPHATLQQAATFAWNQFIALNWPALAKDTNNQKRDYPDTSLPFGDPQYKDPLVWHTFRGKVEIFPTDNSKAFAKGAASDYGYDDRPNYSYGQGNVAPVSGPAPWINLDENSQIGLNKIYAGVVSSTPLDKNAQILFMAKANRNEYRYITANKWWNPVAPDPKRSNPQDAVPTIFRATADFVKAYKRDPVAGSTNCDGNPSKARCVSLPLDSIEIKAAWRRLTPDEIKSGRFYTTLTRHYESADDGKNIKATDEVMGLVGLHIIRKTKSAPYFIYTTFEQADNITDANGNAIEDEDGNYKSALKNVTPMTPNVISNNATANTTQTFVRPGSYPSQPNKQLYYQNIKDTKDHSSGLLDGGIILVNKRINDIPDEIINANKQAHDTIRSYAASKNFKSPPVWLYYKLINVQNTPLGEKVSGIDRFPRSTYYQANSVIETDYNLQRFSGEFDDFRNKKFTITDFTKSGNNLTNVSHGGNSLNMGGCMGCHGNAQAAGSGFSFIFLDSPVTAPEWDTKSLNDSKFRRFMNYLAHP